MGQQDMNVVYASNDAYARHLGTSMYSLFDRNQEFNEINVFVLTLGLSKENQEKLYEIAEKFARKLTLLNLDDLQTRMGFEVDTGGFDISIMLRLFMGDMLPEQIDRVLYLDCDTVVLQSLKHLWKEDLQGKIIGAVMEPTIYEKVKQSIDLKKEDPYYNSGVLLVDLKKWREEDIQKQLLEFLKNKGGKLFASDQDVLNGTLKGRIHTLMPRYNFFTNYRYFSYSELVRLGKTYKAVTMREFQIAKTHPFILHYMGDERPWIAGNLNHYRRAYEQYLNKTPWAGTPKEKGKRFYMLAYHMLDYATAVCPPIRRTVSKQLGMKVVENRKK